MRGEGAGGAEGRAALRARVLHAETIRLFLSFSLHLALRASYSRELT